jgi:hypothetical protein
MEINFESFLKLIPAGFLIWGLVLLVEGQKFEDGKMIHKGLTAFIPVILVFSFVALLNEGIFILPNQPEFSINLYFFITMIILSVLTLLGIVSYYVSKDVPEIVSKAGIAISSFAIVIFFISISMSQKEGIIHLDNVKDGHEFKMVDEAKMSAL